MTSLIPATREPDAGHQLGQGDRVRGDRYRQSHAQLQPGQEVAGPGPGVAAHQDVPLQEYLHQSGPWVGQPPQRWSVTQLL